MFLWIEEENAGVKQKEDRADFKRVPGDHLKEKKDFQNNQT